MLSKRSACSSSGVVKNSEGVVSDSEETFLEYWASFYETLYKSDPKFEFKSEPLSGQFEWEGPQCLNLPPSLQS